MEFGEVEVRKPEPRERPHRDPGLAVEAMGDANPDTGLIFVGEGVLADIVSFSGQAQDREVGGMLVGGHYRSEGSEFIVIEHFLRALHTESGPASVRFTHETFEAAWREIERLTSTGPGEAQILGWHHTHPGYGTFLSSHDLFIQQHFFNLPWQVALVVDPRAGLLKFFRWEGEEVVDTGFLFVKGW
jgi:proteasome lid subunit RPN8/RPN11